MRLPAAALVACLVLSAATVGAADYRMLPGSHLQFSTSYDGEAFDGRFERFVPMLRFDPAALATSRFDVEIELASADTGHAERDEVLVGEEFLDAGGLATARYVATSFRALGGGRFVADGELTLRGATLKVPLTFTWTPGVRPVLDGEATVRRLAFRVGEGDWADTTLLPDEVKVSTHLVLAPVPAPARRPVVVPPRGD